jgi:Tfp pilus assembly protein PilN
VINLLPTVYADSIKYGRQNTVLRNWLIGMAAAMAGLIIIFAGGWLYINQQARTLQKNIDTTNQQLKAQNLAQVQKDAKEITGDIKVITQVLGTEVRFSDLIQAIGNDMPPGAVLSSLSLSKVSGAVDLSTGVLNYSSAAQIAVNLSNSKNDLFSKVDIISVNCTASSNKIYPCTATFKALFSKTAQNKFLSVPKDIKQ